jgi:ribose transport system substrate-binding protein
MKRRELLTALGALAGSAACNRERKKLVAVIPKSASSIFWVSVHAGALSAGQEFALEVLWNGPPTETDYSRQVQIVDSMIARRVDGIALAACDRKALTGVVDRAAAANIPLTVFDSGLDSTNFMSFLATDNVEGGRMGARTLGKLLGGKGEVGIIMHAPGSVSTSDREAGFQEVMQKEFPGIKVVQSQFSMGDRAKGMAVTENILTANPEIDGLFASSEPSAIGATQAVKARNLTGKVKLVGFDSTDSMIEDLKGGVLNAIVVQDPFRMGYEAVKTIADKLNGKQPPKRTDLPAVVVTLENLQTPEIQKLLYPDIKRYLGQ